LAFQVQYSWMSDSDLIRTGDAAVILGTSRQHVVDLCERGELAFERGATHRRLHRREVEAYARRAGSSMWLTRDQRRSLWLHAAVAGHLVRQPDATLATARANLARLKLVHTTGAAASWLDAWSAVLNDGPEAVLRALTAESSLAIELRQNSPFAGVLPDDERAAVLSAFRQAERGSAP